MRARTSSLIVLHAVRPFERRCVSLWDLLNAIHVGLRQKERMHQEVVAFYHLYILPEDKNAIRTMQQDLKRKEHLAFMAWIRKMHGLGFFKWMLRRVAAQIPCLQCDEAHHILCTRLDHRVVFDVYATRRCLGRVEISEWPSFEDALDAWNEYADALEEGRPPVLPQGRAEVYHYDATPVSRSLARRMRRW